jgi:hypothetical protein
MAKMKLNPMLKKLSGNLGDVIFKHYAYGDVVSKRPDMSGIEPTPSQRLQRDRMRCSVYFYREVLANPQLKDAYAGVAMANGISLRAAITQEYMRRSRQEGKLIVRVGLPRGTAQRPAPATGSTGSTDATPAAFGPNASPGGWCW